MDQLCVQMPNLSLDSFQHPPDFLRNQHQLKQKFRLQWYFWDSSQWIVWIGDGGHACLGAVCLDHAV